MAGARSIRRRAGRWGRTGNVLPTSRLRQAGRETLIEWVARHPLLGAAELAALTGEPGGLIGRRLERITRCGAIDADAESVETGRNSRMNRADDLESRYLLTVLGMRWLAARAGVPPAIFANHGESRFASGERTSSRRVVRHREHTLGVNRFAARLALDARAAGWRLAEWPKRGGVDASLLAEDGRIAWIRPDASGVLVRGAESRPFLLEYDRGTLDSATTAAKFEGYRRYYAAAAWRGEFPRRPRSPSSAPTAAQRIAWRAWRGRSRRTWRW